MRHLEHSAPDLNQIVPKPFPTFGSDALGLTFRAAVMSFLPKMGPAGSNSDVASEAQAERLAGQAACPSLHSDQ